MLLIGVPISITLGAATLAALLTLDVPLAVIPQRLFAALDASSIIAIPFFVLAGNFMCEGGISRRLVDFCNSIIGNIRGGMAYAMILACAFFAALSGSAPATVLAIGVPPRLHPVEYNPERRQARRLQKTHKIQDTARIAPSGLLPSAASRCRGNRFPESCKDRRNLPAA